MQLMPTPRASIHRDGSAELFRFVARGTPDSGPRARVPVLLVPSLINRWYVLDLRPGATLAGALVDAGLDVFCLDWGIPADEDRYLEWDDVLARLARAARRVCRESGSRECALLGYCMGGTLAAIHAALEPSSTAALVNLAGPIDFQRSGMLAHMTDARWFDAEAIGAAGNVSPMQMQSGFIALRPTAQIQKWFGLFDRLSDPERREAFLALEKWASENIPFPGAAYVKYVCDLYQKNALVRGEHHVRGRRVRLSDIECPLLTVVTDRDIICPAPAAQALEDLVGSKDKSVLVIPGGHVGAVVGGSAPRELYPRLAAWLLQRLS